MPTGVKLNSRAAIFLFILILQPLLGGCDDQSAQMLSGEAGKRTNPYEEKTLSLSANITQQSYCHVGDEDFTLFLDVQLTFVNISNSPVILSRTIKSPSIITVAKDSESGLNGDFEFPSLTLEDEITNEPPSKVSFGKILDSKRFIVLMPKESYKARVQTGLPGTLKEKGLRIEIKTGSHAVQFGVVTFPYPHSVDELGKLKKSWSRYGHLATNFAYSNFVQFTIPQKFDSPPCPSFE